jgi:hypothetical protein
LHPKRKEYPDDFIAFFRRRFLGTLAIASHHHVVTYEVIDGQETITGYAEWARRHAGDEDNQDVPTTQGKQYPTMWPWEIRALMVSR